jgi:hypothetical protein
MPARGAPDVALRVRQSARYTGRQSQNFESVLGHFLYYW